MGYTHYWYLPKTISKNEWGEFKRDVEKIMEDPAIVNITKTNFVVSDSIISFNGVSDDAYEDFYIAREGEINVDPKGEYAPRRFGFCKTAQKPYDLTVVAVLLALVHHVVSGKISVSSDGTAADWEPGAMVVNRSCGYYDRYNPVDRGN